MAKKMSTNLISTIEGCLKEHRVRLKNGSKFVPLYLIEVTIPNSGFNDFITTYSTELDEFQKQVARQCFEGNEEQSYGVFIDTNLNYIYAFNRQFADLNSTKDNISFSPAQDILLRLVQSNSSSENKLPSTPQNLGSTVFRYSLQGKKQGGTLPITSSVSFEKPSLLARIQSSYAKNTKLVNLAGVTEPYYYLEVDYNTSTYADFVKLYSSELDTFKTNLAKKKYGSGKVSNTYGILMTPNLQMKFAFNTAFTKYDSKSKKLVDSPCEEILLSGGDLDVLASVPPLRRSPRRSFFSGGFRGRDTVIRYSLQGSD